VKPRNRILLVLLAGGVVAGALLLVSRQREPAYQGKTLTQWMNIYCSPDNPTARNLFPQRFGWSLPRGKEAAEMARRQSEAAQAVSHMGTNAIPTLLKWEDKDGQVAWKYKVFAALPKTLQERQSVDWWLVAADHYRVDRAVYGLAILGSNASPAVPELTRRMMTRASGSGVSAAAALANMGGAGLPALLSALTNTQTPNRGWVVRMVGSATRAASNDLSGVLALAHCVRDTNANVGGMAAIELGFITSQPSITVPALIDGLAGTKGQIRARSAYALGYYGPEARPAIPALLRYLNDGDAFVRQSVTNALQKIAPEVLQKNRENPPRTE
jgi:HEAT repeat protein